MGRPRKNTVIAANTGMNAQTATSTPKVEKEVSKEKAAISKIKNFIKGDDVDTAAAKVQRSLENQLKAQIATENAKTFEREEAVERANEAVNNALFNNGKIVTNATLYTQTYLNAVNEFEEAVAELLAHESNIASLEYALEQVTA